MGAPLFIYHQQLSETQTNTQSMKIHSNNKILLVNRSFMLIALLFAFQPIAATSNIYTNIMLAIGAVGFIVLIASIICVLMGKVSLKEYAATEKETTLSLLAISVLGLIISYAYDSNLYKFWLFIMALQLIDLCMQRKRKCFNRAQRHPSTACRKAKHSLSDHAFSLIPFSQLPLRIRKRKMVPRNVSSVAMATHTPRRP